MIYWVNNKITYESEMLMNEWVNESVKRIEVLRQWIKEATSDIIHNALQNELKAERNAIQKVLSWVTKH